MIIIDTSGAQLSSEYLPFKILFFAPDSSLCHDIATASSSTIKTIALFFYPSLSYVSKTKLNLTQVRAFAPAIVFVQHLGLWQCWHIWSLKKWIFQFLMFELDWRLDRPRTTSLWATSLTFRWRMPLLLLWENPTGCFRATRPSDKGNQGGRGFWKGTQCRYRRRSGLLDPHQHAEEDTRGM